MDSTCEICSKTFKKASYKQRHKKLVHAEVKIKFKCWLCEKLYSRKDVLKRHATSIHQKEEINFETVICTKPQADPVPKWIPPPEARPRFRLVYGPEKRLNSMYDHHYKALTVTEAVEITRKQHADATLDLLKTDLYITPSNSDTSTASTGTNCQDETNGEQRTGISKDARIYGIFSN